jgi:hypothetical protein
MNLVMTAFIFNALVTGMTSAYLRDREAQETDCYQDGTLRELA